MTEKAPEWRYYHIATDVSRDQVAAALRDAGGPMTATDIGKAVNCVSLRDCVGTCGRPADGRSLDHHYGDGLDVAGFHRTQAWMVTPHLATLARRGLATREKVGQRVYWSWAGEPVDMAGVEDPVPNADAAVLAGMVEECRERGVEVEWCSKPIEGRSGKTYFGCVWRRDNGPLMHFRISLWEGGGTTGTLTALIAAMGVMESPERVGKRHGLCVGPSRGIEAQA